MKRGPPALAVFVALVVAAVEMATATVSSAQQAPQQPPHDDKAQAEVVRLRLELEALKQTVDGHAALLDSTFAAQVQAEVDALETGAMDQKPNSVSVYGFMDMGLQRFFTDSRLVKGIVASPATTFVSGNNNLYFDARPGKAWRALLELRFALHPHGNLSLGAVGPAPQQDTSIVDSTSASGRNVVRLGSIIVERAVMEWQHDSRLTIQMGYFLTPWGIWNIDHGTPTLISLIMPGFLLNEAILRQQTGVHAFGQFNLNAWTLGYSAYVSNGRTRSQVDLDDDKAFGGRLSLARFSSLRTALGTSFFHGTSEDQVRTLKLGGAGFDVDVQNTVARRETSVGLDLSLDWKGLRVRAEGVVRSVSHRPGQYPRIFVNPLATEPNRTELYVYGLAAYRFGSVEPLFYAEYINSNKRSELVDGGYGLAPGVNIYLSTVSQIKIQYAYSVLDSVYGDRIRLGYLTSRYVLSF